MEKTQENKKYVYGVTEKDVIKASGMGLKWDRFSVNPYSQKEGCFYLEENLLPMAEGLIEKNRLSLEGNEASICGGINSPMLDEIFKREKWEKFLAAFPYLFEKGFYNAVRIGALKEEYLFKSYEDWNRLGFMISGKANVYVLSQQLLEKNISKVMKNLDYHIKTKGLYDIGFYRIIKNDIGNYDVKKNTFNGDSGFESVDLNLGKAEIREFIINLSEVLIEDYKKKPLWSSSQVIKDISKICDSDSKYFNPFPIDDESADRKTVIKAILQELSQVDDVSCETKYGYDMFDNSPLKESEEDKRSDVVDLLELIISQIVESDIVFCRREQLKDLIIKSCTFTIANYYGFKEASICDVDLSLIKKYQMAEKLNVLRSIYIVCATLMQTMSIRSREKDFIKKVSDLIKPLEEQLSVTEEKKMDEVVPQEPLIESEESEKTHQYEYVEELKMWAAAEKEEVKKGIKEIKLVCSYGKIIPSQSIRCEYGILSFNTKDSLDLSFNLHLTMFSTGAEGECIFSMTGKEVLGKVTNEFDREEKVEMDEELLDCDYFEKILSECVITGIDGEVYCRDDENEYVNIVSEIKPKSITILFEDGNAIDLSSIIITETDKENYSVEADKEKEMNPLPEDEEREEEISFNLDEYKEKAFLDGLRYALENDHQFDKCNNITDIPFFKKISGMVNVRFAKSLYQFWKDGFKEGDKLFKFKISEEDWYNNHLIGVCRVYNRKKAERFYFTTLNEYINTCFGVEQEEERKKFLVELLGKKFCFMEDLQKKSDAINIVLLDKNDREEIIASMRGKAFVNFEEHDCKNDFSLNSDVANNILNYLGIDIFPFYDVSVVYYAIEYIDFPSMGVCKRNISLKEAIAAYDSFPDKSISVVGAYVENGLGEIKDIKLFPCGEKVEELEVFKENKILEKAKKRIHSHIFEKYGDKIFTGVIPNRTLMKTNITVTVWNIKKEKDKTYKWRDYTYLTSFMKKSVKPEHYNKTLVMNIKTVKDFSSFLEDFYTIINRKPLSFNEFLLSDAYTPSLAVGDVLSITTEEGQTLDYYVNSEGFYLLPHFSGKRRGGYSKKKDALKCDSLKKFYLLNPVTAIWENSRDDISIEHAKIIASLDGENLIFPKDDATLSSFFSKGNRLAEAIFKSEHPIILQAVFSDYPLFRQGELLSLKKANEKVCVEKRAIQKLNQEFANNIQIGADSIIFNVIVKSVLDGEFCVYSFPLTIHMGDMECMDLIDELERYLNEITSAGNEYLVMNKIQGKDITSEKRLEIKNALADIIRISKIINSVVRKTL